MGLQFILGRAGAEIGSYCLEEIERELKQDPKGDPIFYIVPDQMAFQQEYDLLRKSDLAGSIRAQVFSFSRLAWYVFQEVGGGTKPFITSTGIQMLLRKIAEEHQESFDAFQKAMDKQGFIDQLETMITELKRYRVTPETLQSVLAELNQFEHLTPNEVALKHKLEDLSMIYERLDQQLKGHYVDSEDQLNMLVEKLAETNVLKDATIYIDGFHRFTPQEYYVIESLMRYAKDVKIALVYDGRGQGLGELDLFYQTKTTYETLEEIAQTFQIKVDEPVKLYPDERRFKDNQAFQHLEREFGRQPTPKYEGSAPIKLVEAVHPRAEVEGMAQEIVRLTREEGYRYRDLAILIREDNTYHDLIETIFKDYKIPVFLDEKKTMLNHPFIELIRTGLEVVERNWRYDALFRLLKTGFVKPTDEQYPLTADAIDLLENYCLEYGIRTRDQWLSNKEWTYQRLFGLDFRKQTDEELAMQKQINAYRKQVVDALESFDRNVREAETVEARLQAVFAWLEHLNAPETLEALRDDFDEQGEIEVAREQEQAWQAVMQLFDEMVDMLGEEEFSFKLFREVIEAGFETLKFSHVPPTIDHVIVGNVERSRIANVKVCFILGVNDGVYPMKPPSEGLVTDDEREWLESKGMMLADQAERVLLDDRFYMYLAFTLASDKMWVSYPLSDEEGKQKMPASIVKQLKEMFADLDEKFLLDDEDDEDPMRFITNPVKARAILTAELSKYLRGYPTHDVYWDTLHWFMNEESKKGQAQTVLSSLFYRNEPQSLQDDTASQLFDQTMRSSVSRLETYHQCAYHYFAKYTLGLQERNLYKLEAPDIGQLFHESLRYITEWVFEDGKAFFELTSDDILKYARRAVEQLAPMLQHQILFSSNRYQYILRKLEQVIIRATTVLAKQSKHTDFTPAGIEIGFGKKEKLPPLQLDLMNGYKLELSGRVDRVDQAEIDDRLFLRIIDYKSSKKDLSLVDVYYGLALQMLTYLDVVLTYSDRWLGKQADPAGVLYFHVHNPTLNNTGLKSLDDDAVEEALFKEYKMNGLLLEDERIAEAMDRSLEQGSSKIAPFGVKKDGSFDSRSKTVDEDLFKRMNQYVRGMMRQAGNEIVSGEVKLDPVQKKDHVACTFCPYKSVCQFDPSLEENEFERLKDEKDETILEKMVQREGEK
ncbi:helicase-exonuclease AddAB subunit AddB [Alkalibacillus haloalkaliphilus]|uniref:helicase-exonuclease AddAB subunit AddB n=1 Tax=Alkalibacillus haloalkaliphilus TaxID=94136 RepID=UPI0029365742|nr:helicase-exonuclease AddAB subunit AddB [Alkalibacillus haloalkaliphilus]MDV2583205.1 helicase-exonuclease AddAB subunit AddB [Alkalibacillus haloalkaliphilus]